MAAERLLVRVIVNMRNALVPNVARVVPMDSFPILRAALKIGFVAAIVGSGCGVAAKDDEVSTTEQAAVVRPFTLNYDGIVYGDFLQAGNANTKCPGLTAPTDPFGEPQANCPLAQDGSYTGAGGINDSYYMEWADVDNDAATFNSTTGSITIPAGTSVTFARLSWGGDTGTIRLADGTVSPAPGCSTRQFLAGAGTSVLPAGTPESTSVRLAVGTGASAAVTPAVISRDSLANVPSSQPQFYAAHADVTARFTGVATGDPQTITLGNVWTPQGFGCFAGWSLVVVYSFDGPTVEVPTGHQVFVYDGHVRQSSLDPTTTITISGFRVASAGTRVGLTAYEGDFNISGDRFLVNGAAVAEPVSGVTTNFFVSNAEGDLNPTLLNNMSVDSKQFTAAIPVGSASADLGFATTGDTYLAQNVVLSVPVASLNITITQTTPGPIHSGDTVTYQVTAVSLGDQSTNVDVASVAAPGCDRDLGTLASDDPFIYTCTSVAGNNTFPVTVTVTGENAFNDPLTDSSSVTVTVVRLTQTINFTSTEPTDAVVGGAQYAATATATSALAVAFTIAASSSAVCTISGALVSFIGVGSCVINANQAGSVLYDPATQVQQTVAVGQGAQTILFAQPGDKLMTVGTFTVSATGGLSTSPVTFSSSSPGTCSVTGSTVTLVAAGDCTVQADQAGDANYTAAAPVSRTFTISRADQTISFTSTAPTAAVVGGLTYVATATATSTLAVVFTIAAGSSAVCTISGVTVSFVGVGSCVINANQAGNASYNAAVQEPQTFAVGQGAQTITFAPLGNKLMTAGSFTVSATGGASTSPVIFSSSTPLTCTVTAVTTVTLVGEGTCTIQADQAGDANYNAAAPLPRSFTISRTDQTIGFTSTIPASPVVDGAPYVATAIATSTLAVTITIDASSSAVCTISGATVSFIGAGSCVINANQAGNTSYNPAVQVPQTVVVGQGAQTITFASLLDKLMTDVSVTVSATGGASSNPVIFSTSTPAACSVSGPTVTLVAAGTCIVRADQAGNANYTAATQVSRSFAISRASQTITFPAITSFTWSGGSALLTASTTSPLAVVYSVTSGACSVSGATLTATAAGSCIVAADQAGNGVYAAAIRASATAVVTAANQTITFPPIATFSWRNGLATLTATASSSLPVSYSVLSGPCSTTNGNVLLPSASTLIATGAGTCVVAADQVGNSNYAGAERVTSTVIVTKASQTIGFLAPPGRLAIDPSFVLSATSDSSNPVTFSTTSTACSISGATVTQVLAGECVIHADQAEDANYFAATPVVQTFTVSRAPQVTTFPELAVFSWHGGSATLSATASSTLAVSYTLRSGPCSLAGNTVTASTAGICVVAADQAGDNRYFAAPHVTAIVIVTKADQVIELPSLGSGLSPGHPVALDATATSGLPISYQVQDGPCSIAGSLLLATGPGTCVVTADQGGNASYNPAPKVTASVTTSEPVVNDGGCSATGSGSTSSFAMLIVVVAGVSLRRRRGSSKRWLLAAGLTVMGCGDDLAGDFPPEIDSSVRAVSLGGGEAVTIDATAVDPQGKPLTYVASPPTHGAVTGTGPIFSYQADAAYSGTDSFAIIVSNDVGSVSLTVNLTISPVNAPPVSNDQASTTNQGAGVAIVLVAFDPEGATLSYQIDAPPAHGVLTGTPPSVLYTPDASYAGSDEFTFETSDGELTSNVASVLLTIVPLL